MYISQQTIFATSPANKHDMSLNMGSPINLKRYAGTELSKKWQQYIKARIEINGKKGCWIWSGNRYDTGYGMACVRRFSVSAHRLSYNAFKGDLSSKLLVLHNCNNKACVNPNHLRLGTVRDNIFDAMAAGTVKPIPLDKSTKKGEAHGMSKINNKDIKKIFELRKQGYFQREIAEEVGISRPQVSCILTGRGWKHLKYKEQEEFK